MELLKNPSERREPAILGSFGWLVAFLAIQFAATAAVMTGQWLISGQPVLSSGDINFTVAIAGVLLGFLIVLAFRWGYLTSHLQLRGGINHRTVALVGLLILFLLGAEALYASYIIPGQDLQPEVQILYAAMNESFIGMALVILSTVIVGPVVEEVLFRGQLLGAIKRKMNNHGQADAIAIVLSAMAFAFIHLQPQAFPVLFLSGLAMGWLKVKTGSLTAPIAMHMLMNAIAMTMLQVSGP